MEVVLINSSALPTCTLLCSQYMMDGMGNRRMLCHVRVIRAACVLRNVSVTGTLSNTAHLSPMLCTYTKMASSAFFCTRCHLWIAALLAAQQVHADSELETLRQERHRR